jgi:peptidoglycan/xylan/chitin deacetylase (PgdA/CDA1 family)
MLTPRTIADIALAATATAATAATLAIAAYTAESQLFGSTLIAGPDPLEVALTYDDGPNATTTLNLLDVLATHNARATFFMIGRYARQQPEIVRTVHAAGHLIANHTETHPWLTMLPAKRIREELRTCNQALEDVIGQPIRYFRAPHGARRPAVLCIAHELNLTPVQWNVMGSDWKPIGADTIEGIIEMGLKRAFRNNIGANILLHDGSDQALGADRSDTIEVTDRLLKQFVAERRPIVTVDAWG